jgi:hypothetical protein
MIARRLLFTREQGTMIPMTIQMCGLYGNIWNFEGKKMHENMDSPPVEPNYNVITVHPLSWSQNKEFKEWCAAVDSETRSSSYYILETSCDNCKEKIKVFLRKGLRLDTAKDRLEVICPECKCKVKK